VGRQAQGDQRRERRADQPGHVGRQRRTDVAVLGRKVRGHGAGRLAVRQAQDHEAHQDEDVLAHAATVEQGGRKAAERRDHSGQATQREAAADAVGQQARGHDAGSAKHRADHLHHQEFGDRLVRIQRDPRQREHGDQVEQRVAGQRGERADQDVGARRADKFGQAGGFQFALFGQARVFVGGHEAQAGEQRHHVDREGHVEAVAPAPVEEVFARQARVQVGEQCAGNEEADGRAQLAQHGVPAAAVGRRVQRQQRRQAVPRTAQRQALAEAEHRQQHDGREAKAGVARQEGDAGGGRAEHEKRQGQLGFSPETSLDGHRDDSSERTRDEGERENQERVENTFKMLLEREENRRKHQHRGDAVDEKVKIFGCAADDHADRDFAGGDVRVVVTLPGADFGRVRQRLGALRTDAGRRHCFCNSGVTSGSDT